MSEELTISIPAKQLRKWRDLLAEAENPTVQFDRDQSVMTQRAYDARGDAIAEVLREMPKVAD